MSQLPVPSTEWTVPVKRVADMPAEGRISGGLLIADYLTVESAVCDLAACHLMALDKVVPGQVVGGGVCTH